MQLALSRDLDKALLTVFLFSSCLLQQVLHSRVHDYVVLLC